MYGTLGQHWLPLSYCCTSTPYISSWTWYFPFLTSLFHLELNKQQQTRWCLISGVPVFCVSFPTHYVTLFIYLIALFDWKQIQIETMNNSFWGQLLLVVLSNWWLFSLFLWVQALSEELVVGGPRWVSQWATLAASHVRTDPEGSGGENQVLLTDDRGKAWTSVT